MPNLYYDLYIEEFDLEVQLECSVIKCNDGIGDYEYWGFKGHDEGQDYIDIEEIEWDKTLFREDVNEIIENYVKKHWDKITEDALKNFDESDYL